MRAGDRERHREKKAVRRPLFLFPFLSFWSRSRRESGKQITVSFPSTTRESRRRHRPLRIGSFFSLPLCLLPSSLLGAMGRKSSAKDRAYITQSERKDGYGSIRSGANASSAVAARRAALVSLPFTHCRLTCERWLDPVCTPDGDVFDVTAAVPAIRANGVRNPLTGEALALKDLVRLHYHRVGAAGRSGDPGNGASSSSSSHAAAAPFGCPVTGKAFTPSSHIVAIRTTGNVFSFEAVEKLNLKSKHFRDLVDDTPFTKGDVIHLQDPADVSGTAAARAEKVSKAATRAFATAAVSPRCTSSSSAAAAAAAASDAGGGSKSGLDRSALGKDAQRILGRLSAGPAGAPAGGRGDRGASRVPGADPRLRAPERERVAAPAFKAGAATWDTAGDDASQQQGLSFQMRRDAERRRRKREEAEEEEEQQAGKLREANRRARDGGGGGGGQKLAPRPYGDRVFERLASASKAAAAAASRPVAFTSSVTPLLGERASAAPPSELPSPPRLRKPKAEKGYCRLRTSLGGLNLELFAGAAPRAVENFIVLAQSGYYDGCVFHRSVRNFCAQSGVSCVFFFLLFVLLLFIQIRGRGSYESFFLEKKTHSSRSLSLSLARSLSLSLARSLSLSRALARSLAFSLSRPPPFFFLFETIEKQQQDPTGTGRGGESMYGGPFPYEGPGAASLGGASGGGGGRNKSSSSSSSPHSHDGRGVLAMANSGDRDSNGSQFYLLYKSARHLDGKHTVFGRVAGGASTLDAIERVPTDERDRPKEPVVIEGVDVFVDPFEGGGEDSEEEEEEEEAKVKWARAAAAAAAAAAEEEEEGRKRARWFSGPAPAAGGAGGVGRYISSTEVAPPAVAPQQQQQARAAAQAQAKKKGGGFGNFDAW